MLPETESIAEPDEGLFVTALDVIVGASNVNVDPVPKMLITTIATETPDPLPFAGVHCSSVCEVHPIVRQEDAAKITVGVYPPLLWKPKFMPPRVMDGRAVVGRFCADDWVATGASKVKADFNVPVTPRRLTMTDADPAPRFSVQDAEVADDHVVVRQSETPIVCVDVALFASKFRPDTVK